MHCSAISTLSRNPTPELLIELAFTKKLQDIHATVLSVKARANHAQHAAPTPRTAPAAVSPSRTYALAAAAAAPTKPPPSQNP